jgi:hypothetical protein
MRQANYEKENCITALAMERKQQQQQVKQRLRAGNAIMCHLRARK